MTQADFLEIMNCNDPVELEKMGPIQIRSQAFSDCIDAIRGAVAFGRQDVNQPPDGHWLAEFWNIGKELRDVRHQTLEDAAEQCDMWALQLTAYDSAKCATAETCACLVRELKEPV
jgi:hypothetical protein